MDIRKTLAGLALAGTLALGGATAASAQADPAPTPASHPVACNRAEVRVEVLQTRLNIVGDRITELQKLHDQLVSQGHDQAAQKVADFITKAQNRLNTLQTRLDKVKDRIAEYCGDAPASSPSS